MGGREADPEDRADVAVSRAGEHAFIEGAERLVHEHERAPELDLLGHGLAIGRDLQRHVDRVVDALLRTPPASVEVKTATVLASSGATCVAVSSGDQARRIERPTSPGCG